MLKTIGWLLFGLLISTMTTSAQTKVEEGPRRTMTFTGEPGKMWMLNEVGLIASETDGKIRVDAVAPTQARPKGYEAIDLKEGDIIAMANGKKISSAKLISDLYDALKVGDDLKLGIKRGEQMLMVTVKKADPSTLPVRRMVINEDGPGKSMEFTGGGSMDIDPSIEEITVIGGAGIIIGLKGKQVVVAEKLPRAKEILGDAAIDKGDVILKLQDAEITNVGQFEKAFNEIAVGTPVTITLKHGATELKASFTKQESKFRTVIKKN